MTLGPLAIVTVVFKAELPLLELQARSIAAHVAPGDVRDIIVIYQGRKDAGFRQLCNMIHLYGRQRECVHIFAQEEIADIPQVDGWIAQQILKLKVADLIGQDFYLILDAKTHFIRPFSERYFFKDGSIEITGYPYHDHNLRPRLETALRYLGVDHLMTSQFPSSVPPIILETGIVRDLIRNVETESGTSFEVEFVQRGLTEFFLYFAYVIKVRGSISPTYRFNFQHHSPTVWEHQTKRNQVAHELSRGTHSPIMSVHRRSYVKLDRGGATEIANAWRAGGIFRTADEGLKYIRRYRRQYLPSFLVNYARRRLGRLLRR